MPDPRVPGERDRIELACGESVHPGELDLGTRELACDCGETHAVVADARHLHETVVELVIELMEHAVSHADDAAMSEFEESMLEFDVSAFVEQYRDERETEADDVPGYSRG